MAREAGTGSRRRRGHEGVGVGIGRAAAGTPAGGALLLLALALAVALLPSRVQACPNQCNGHGVCDANSRCTCFPNFAGPDCGQRVCDAGRRWFGRPTRAGGDTHTLLAECAGAGECDEQTGKCTCNDGLAGAACEVSACLADAAGDVCSKRGACRTMREIHRMSAVPGSLTAQTEYSGWDANRVRGCYCDAGFGGPSCDQLMCRRGDNPRTRGQQRRAVVIRADYATIPSSSRILRLFFAGASTSTVDLDAITDATCAERFGTAATIDAEGTVCKVTRAGQATAVTAAATNGATEVEIVLSVTFPRTRTAQNNLFAHDESPPISMFSCAFDEGISAALRASTTCSVSYADVQSLALEGAGAGSAPPSIPVGDSYIITVADDTSLPNTAVVTYRVEGTPPTLTSYAAAPIDALSVTVGGSSTLRFVVASRSGHTKNAAWVVSSSVGAINAVRRPGYREYDWCSGQGRCDFSSGVCTCFGDAYGSACEALLSEAPSNSDLPALSARAESATFGGNVLEISTRRPLVGASNPPFNFLSVSDASNGPFFKLDGSGLLSGMGMEFLRGGRVDRGLVAAMSDGLVGSFASTPALSVYFGSTANTPPNGVAHVLSEFPVAEVGSGGYAVLRAAARRSLADSTRDPLFQVLGDGTVEVSQNTLQVKAGVRVSAGGMLITSTGGSASFMDSAVVGGGLSVRGGSVSVGAGLLANAALVRGMTSLLGGASAGAMLTVSAGGLSVAAGGLRVQAGGVSVGAGGLAVAAGAVSASGGGLIFGQDGVSEFVGRMGTSLTTGGSISALSATFGGTVLTLSAEGSAPGPYQFLAAKSGAVSVALTSGSALVGSAGLFVGSKDKASAGGAAGTASVMGGRATGAGAGAGSVLVAGGDGLLGAGSGGGVRVSGGASSVTAGSVTLVGGSGHVTAGHAIIRGGPSAAGTPGSVVLQDAAGAARATVNAGGNVHLSPAVYTHAAGAFSVTGAARVSSTLQVGGSLSPLAGFGMSALTMCAASDWTTAGAPCDSTVGGFGGSMFGGDPAAATSWKLYLNADFAGGAARTVKYGSSAGAAVTVAAGGVFVVFT